MELSALYLALDGVEVGSNGVYTGGVAYQDDAVGQLLWAQVQVETATVFIYNQLRWSKYLLFFVHSTKDLLNGY